MVYKECSELNMTKITKVEALQQDLHFKGWGCEVWIENRPEYCGKLLVFEAGKKCSMHFHMNKTETMYLQSGRIDIDILDPDTSERYTVCLHPGDSLLIERGTMHQICALRASELFEFSTTHEDSDSYRIHKGD